MHRPISDPGSGAPFGFPLPSAEVRAEALAQAERLAAGLFPHQVEGLAFLLGRRRAILADDMGLGKTRQSVLALTHAAPRGPWLVVSPASVKQNWAREIAAVREKDPVLVVGPGAPPEPTYLGWVVINYDLLSKHASTLSGLPWAGLVFDEAHYLKNHTSKRSKLARALVACAPEAPLHALTGTPLTNRPRDLFPLLQLVGHPMGRSFLSFAKRYCAAYHNGYGWVTDGASNLEELRVQLHGVMLRRTKEEVLDLPPKLRAWVPVTVPEKVGRRETRRVLERLLAGALSRLGGSRDTGPAGEGEDARASAGGLGRDRIRLLADLTKARVAIASAKVPTTIEFVEGVVAQGEKVIVFSSFEDPVLRIAEHFGEQAVVVTGGTPAARRPALVDRFQSDPGTRVFVANLVAGGVGTNLTAARQVVFNDLDWVPANHWQAEDRAYRIGQTGTVNVTYFCAQGTIDEFVASVLRSKGALIEAVVEGRGGLALDSDLLAELEALVRSLSPRLASLPDADSGEDPVDRLLREAVEAAGQREEAELRPVRAVLRALPAEAVLALARVLSGPRVRRYRARSGSKAGAFHVLDVDGGDVTCSCPGFEYRGACTHARGLKAALATGKGLPPGVEEMEA
jgi:SWI/SNF-related matrix-associated actin-dependent regulator 1 of chromatin subfamily A